MLRRSPTLPIDVRDVNIVFKYIVNHLMLVVGILESRQDARPDRVQDVFVGVIHVRSDSVRVREVGGTCLPLEIRP